MQGYDQSEELGFLLCLHGDENFMTMKMPLKHTALVKRTYRGLSGIFFPALRDIVCARQQSLLERRAVATRSHLGGIRPGSDRGFAESRRRSDRVATTTTPAGAARLGTPVRSPF